jgi:peptidase E
MVRDLVIDCLEANGVPVFGLSGGAVVAGSEKRNFHFVPVPGRAVAG